MITGKLSPAESLGNRTDLGQAQSPVHHQGGAGTADRQQMPELGIDHQSPSSITTPWPPDDGACPSARKKQLARIPPMQASAARSNRRLLVMATRSAQRGEWPIQPLTSWKRARSHPSQGPCFRQGAPTEGDEAPAR